MQGVVLIHLEECWAFVHFLFLVPSPNTGSPLSLQCSLALPDGRVLENNTEYVHNWFVLCQPPSNPRPVQTAATFLILELVAILAAPLYPCPLHCRWEAGHQCNFTAGLAEGFETASHTSRPFFYQAVRPRPRARLASAALLVPLSGHAGNPIFNPTHYGGLVNGGWETWHRYLT